MKVYVLGNKDVSDDRAAFDVEEKLKGKDLEIEFVEINPNEDLPFSNEEDVVLLDAIEGISEVTILDDIDMLVTPRSVSAHDYDLGFQLKYLKKLGKISKITIIGLPQKGKMDYFLIQSTLRKLVAHEMQGS